MRFLVIAMVLWACTPMLASAEMIVTVEDTQLPFSTAVQTSSFEVYVQSDESTPPQLADFQVTLSLTESAIQFTGVAKPTVHPYALAAVSSFFGGSVLSGGSEIKGGDSGFFDSAPLNDGAGLLAVSFEVSGGMTPGDYGVSILTGSNDTFLSDATGSDLPGVSFRNGTITIVPEPANAVLLWMGLFSVAAAMVRRAR